MIDWQKFKWAVGAVALVVVLGWWAFASAAERGALREKLAQNALHIAALDSSLTVERGKFQRDTVKVFRRIDHTDSVFAEVVKSDTLRLTDTVKVTVEVVREAVATLNACKETVKTCGELRALEQQRADSLAARVKLMEAARPSILSRCGLSAGYGATDKGVGPAVLVGCRLFP